MNQNYEPEFKKKIVRLHLEEGRTLRGLDFMKENFKLKRQLAELQKENDFLKKAAAFFAKEID